MSVYDVTVTLEADSIQNAVNRLLYPDGIPVEGVSKIWAEEVTE